MMGIANDMMEATMEAQTMAKIAISQRDEAIEQRDELVSMLASCVVALQMVGGDSLLTKEALALLAKVTARTTPDSPE